MATHLKDRVEFHSVKPDGASANVPTTDELSVIEFVAVVTGLP